MDYADGGKNNLWHRYGAAAAAAVFRSILERKSATIAEAPDSASPGILDGVQAGYVADIRAGVASAVVAAEASRVPVVGVVRRWRYAHEAANRRPRSFDPSTGESLTTFISPQQAQAFVGEAITALNEAVESVGAHTLQTLTAMDLLSDVTDSDNVRNWLDQLRRDLEQMCDTAGHWPAASSGNRLEPPPADDDGDLSAVIVAVRTSLVSVLKCLAGEDVPAPPPPPEPIHEEPSEVQKRVQYLLELSERLAPYGRVKSKPFNADDHNAAVEAAGELVDQTGIGLVANELAMFTDVAANIARNATVEQWAVIVEDGARLEPLILAVQLLKAYHDVLEEAGNLGLAATAIDLATQRLSTLPGLLATDEFWESTTPDNVGRLLRYWSSADESNDPRELLGQRAAGSKIGLCQVLHALASTMRRQDSMTGEVKIIREIRNFFRDLNGLVDPPTMRHAIEEFFPEAKSFDRWTVPDHDDCLRLAVQFNTEFPVGG